MEVPNATGNETKGLDDKTTMFFAIMCFAIISMVGMIANVVIIVKLMKHKRKSSEYFILNLSITDLVVCSLCIPLDIYDQFAGTWKYGAFMCKIIWPFQTLFTLISILTLTAMAIERHRVIMTPFKPRLTRSDLLKVILLIWFIGFCVIAPYIHHLEYDGTECIEKWPHKMSGAYYTLSLLIIDYCIPLTIIAYCYGRAGYKLFVNTREFKTVNSGIMNHMKRLERNKRVIKIFSFAVLVFLICMLPSDIYWMWSSFGDDSDFAHKKNFETFSYILIYSNSCFNPFIFGACNFSCFRKKSSMSSHRKLVQEGSGNANSMSSGSNGHHTTSTKGEKKVEHDDVLIDFNNLSKLRETDI